MPDSVAFNDTSKFFPNGNYVGTGAITAAVVCKPTSITGYDWLVVHDPTGGSPNSAPLGLLNGTLTAWAGGGSETGTITIPATNEWYLCAMTKPAGTVTTRFHLYRYSTATWTHSNAAGTLPDFPSTDGINIAWQSGEYFEGSILMAGCWDSALSDATIETLIWGTAAWIDAEADEAWRFDSQLPITRSITGTSVQTIGAGSPGLDSDSYPDMANDVVWADLVPRGNCLFTDSFNRADGDLTTPWETFADWDAMKIISNFAWGDGEPSGSIYTGKVFDDDQWAAAPLSGLTGAGTTDNTGHGVMVRASDSAENCYTAVVNQDGEIAVGKYIAGSYTSIAIFNVGFTTGSILRLEAEGTTLRVFYDRTFVGQTTDASISSGYPGLCRKGTSGTSSDHFSAGNLNPPGPNIAGVAHITAAGSDSVDLYVPADTTYIAGFTSYWDPTPGMIDPPELNSVAFDMIDNTRRGDAFGAIFVLPAPDTGMQTFEWAWEAGSPQDEGGHIVLVFLKDVHTSPLRDAVLKSADASAFVPTFVDSEPDDMVLALVSCYGGTPAQFAGFPIQDTTTYNDQMYYLCLTGAGDGSTPIDTTSTSYPVLGAISFPSAASTENLLYIPLAAAADDASGYYVDSAGDWPPNETWTDDQGQVSLESIKYDQGGSESAAGVILVRFDTSDIPDGATITGATLKFYVMTDTDLGSGNTNRYIVGDYYDFGGGATVAGDWIETASPSIFDQIDIGDLENIENMPLNIDMTDLSGINKSGYTGFRITNSGYTATFNHDMAAFASYESAVHQSPRLRVSYTTEDEEPEETPGIFIPMRWTGL